MSFKRYEITLPTRFNDGSAVTAEPFHLTYEEVVERFGAVTVIPQSVRGSWTHDGQRYEEDNIRFYVDVEDTVEAAEFFRKWKETLKSRFGQIDIWIVSYSIGIT